MTIEHLPSEQVGKGYFGQRQHPVQINVVLAHVAPHATFSPLAWAIKFLFSRISGLAPCMLKTRKKPGDRAALFPCFRDEI